MPYFECAVCGQLASVSELERTELREYCPGCEAETTWTLAFESDAGVSF